MGDLRSARGDWGSSSAGRTSIINHASLVQESESSTSGYSSNLCKYVVTTTPGPAVASRVLHFTRVMMVAARVGQEDGIRPCSSRSQQTSPRE